MKRRDFIKAGITAMVAAQLNPFESIRSIAHADPVAADIARVKGRDIVNMVQRGLDAIGGIGSFVKPGQTVAIKPNFSWGRNPEEAYKTADRIIKNTYRTLMTRGMKGCFVYCVDEGLRDYLRSAATFRKDMQHNE